MNTRNIFLAGVGGQGILLAGEILCLGLMEAGYDVKKSEVHGMAQRGGSVTSHVRFGERVHSPLIPEGEADILVGFEALEALRWIGALRPDGLLVVNRQQIKSTSVTSGNRTYPEDIFGILTRQHANVRLVDGLSLGRQAGDVRSVNSVLVGAASNAMDIPVETWEKVIRRRLPERFVEMNLRAFELGRNA